MARARLLIVTASPLCRNPRVLKEATTLAQDGNDTTVLTVVNSERYEAYDREILASAPFRRLALDLLSPGRRVRFRSLRGRARTWLARHAARSGVEFAAALGPVGGLTRLARAFPADLTLVHNEAGFCVGAALLRDGRRVAADFEDWHSQDLLPEDRRFRPLRLLRRLEAMMLRRTAYASATSAAMAGALHGAYEGTQPLVLRNVFPLQPPPLREERAQPPAFFWFSQTIGPGRMLEPFLAGWGQTRQPSRLCLLGEVRPGYRAHLESLVPPDRRSSLEFLAFVAPGELPGVIGRHDIGLALEATSPPSRNVTITNKIFQYLNAGLAVVATDTAGQREVLGLAPGAGVLLSLADASPLAGALDRLLADRPGIEAMGRAARRAAETTFCWEKESPRLLAAVAGALAGKEIRR